jgi:hypothetical protein
MSTESASLKCRTIADFQNLITDLSNDAKDTKLKNANKDNIATIQEKYRKAIGANLDWLYDTDAETKKLLTKLKSRLIKYVKFEKHDPLIQISINAGLQKKSKSSVSLIESSVSRISLDLPRGRMSLDVPEIRVSRYSGERLNYFTHNSSASSIPENIDEIDEEIEINRSRRTSKEFSRRTSIDTVEEKKIRRRSEKPKASLKVQLENEVRRVSFEHQRDRDSMSPLSLDEAPILDPDMDPSYK